MKAHEAPYDIRGVARDIEQYMEGYRFAAWHFGGKRLSDGEVKREYDRLVAIVRDKRERGYGWQLCGNQGVVYFPGLQRPSDG